jgi:glutathione S-transferase
MTYVMFASCMQMPVLFHGSNIVPDSNAIVEYLHNTYPSQMAMFVPADPMR